MVAAQGEVEATRCNRWDRRGERAGTDTSVLRRPVRPFANGTLLICSDRFHRLVTVVPERPPPLPPFAIGRSTLYFATAECGTSSADRTRQLRKQDVLSRQVRSCRACDRIVKLPRNSPPRRSVLRRWERPRPRQRRRPGCPRVIRRIVKERVACLSASVIGRWRTCSRWFRGEDCPLSSYGRAPQCVYHCRPLSSPIVKENASHFRSHFRSCQHHAR
jgi:hypothetical protein